MRVIASMDALRVYLANVQNSRASEIRCELTADFSAKASDAAIAEALVLGLPMAQGVKYRILRSRGRGAVITAKVHYREGLRMLCNVQLTKAEAAALDVACSIAHDALAMDEEDRFQFLYDWVCRNIRYVHTAPGQKEYEKLVGVSGVLQEKQANCQGFADVVYLLCRLGGIQCEYRIGRGERRLHVWNSVCINGVWQEVDASKGARRLES